MSESELETNKSASRAKILCVDDDPSVIGALSRVLGFEFEVLTASSGEEALTLIEEHSDVAVVLSDHRMNGMTGLELLLEIRKRAPHAVRAILSAQMDLAEVSQAINAAAIHRFILKPWDNDYLRIQMMEALANHSLLAEKSELERLSITDPVTHLANHRHFQDRLRIETERALRHNHPLSLIMIDIDHFKSFNDQFGHPAGDQLLRSVASRLERQLRAMDIVARYGGEEFAVILPETSPDGAVLVADRLRANFEHDAFPGPDGRATFVTISLGVAAVPMHGSTSTELIQAADRALYQAKRQGRNQTAWAPIITGKD